jgi:hypothetical protein
MEGINAKGGNDPTYKSYNHDTFDLLIQGQALINDKLLTNGN